MYQVCIIGSSKIVYHHIKAIQANNIKIYSICSTRKNSKNSKIIQKKFNIPNRFNDWKKCITESSKQKNIFFLVCPRIKDTYKIVNFLHSKNLKIFSEKPLSLKINELKKFKKKQHLIFVGYNRIFYKSINYISKMNLNNCNISVNCPDKNKYEFQTNSCHIISILLFIFKGIKLIKKFKNQNSIFCIFADKKNNIINLNVNFNSPTNFCISIKSNKFEILLNPIEKMKIFNKMQIKEKNNLKIYKQKIYKELDEFKSKLKPGFKQQYKEFKKSVLCKKKHSFSNIDFSIKVMNMVNKVIS